MSGKQSIPSMFYHLEPFDLTSLCFLSCLESSTLPSGFAVRALPMPQTTTTAKPQQQHRIQFP